MLESWKDFLSSPAFYRIWTSVIVTVILIILIYDSIRRKEARKEYINLIKNMFEKDKDVLQNLKIGSSRKVYINLKEFGKLISFLEYGNKYLMLVRCGIGRYYIVVVNRDKVKMHKREVYVSLQYPTIIGNYIGDACDIKEYVHINFWKEYNEYLMEEITRISDNLVEANPYAQQDLKHLREFIEYEVIKKLRPHASLKKEEMEGLEDFRRRP